MLRPDPCHRDEACRWARRLLDQSRWVILDTETTGLDRSAEAVQIAIIAPDGTSLLDSLVRPTSRIPPDATAIHGITDAMVATAPSFTEIYPQLQEIVRGKTIVAYNAAFDSRILRQTCHCHRVPPLIAQWECAMEQYARYVGQWSSRLGGYRWQPLPRPPSDHPMRHQAIDDCRATLEVIRRMAHLAVPF